MLRDRTLGVYATLTILRTGLQVSYGWEQKVSVMRDKRYALTRHRVAGVKSSLRSRLIEMAKALMWRRRRFAGCMCFYLYATPLPHSLQKIIELLNLLRLRSLGSYSLY